MPNRPRNTIETCSGIGLYEFKNNNNKYIIHLCRWGHTSCAIVKYQITKIKPVMHFYIWSDFNARRSCNIAFTLDPSLTQVNPVHTFTPVLSMMHFKWMRGNENGTHQYSSKIAVFFMEYHSLVQTYKLVRKHIFHSTLACCRSSLFY